jgi:hypothetical protein
VAGHKRVVRQQADPADDPSKVSMCLVVAIVEGQCLPATQDFLLVCNKSAFEIVIGSLLIAVRDSLRDFDGKPAAILIGSEPSRLLSAIRR